MFRVFFLFPWFFFTVLSWAHPHIFVDARPDLVFDSNGLKGVKQHWVFDEMYSAAMISSIDQDKNGKIVADELDSMYKYVIQPVERFSFFNHLVLGESFLKFSSAVQFKATIVNGQLVCDFLLPVVIPAGSDYSMLLLVMADPANYTQMSTQLEQSQVLAPSGIEVEFFTDGVSDMTLFKGLPSTTQGVFFRFRRSP